MSTISIGSHLRAAGAASFPRAPVSHGRTSPPSTAGVRPDSGRDRTPASATPSRAPRNAGAPAGRRCVGPGSGATPGTGGRAPRKRGATSAARCPAASSPERRPTGETSDPPGAKSSSERLMRQPIERCQAGIAHTSSPGSSHSGPSSPSNPSLPVPKSSSPPGPIRDSGRVGSGLTGRHSAGQGGHTDGPHVRHVAHRGSHRAEAPADPPTRRAAAPPRAARRGLLVGGVFALVCFLFGPLSASSPAGAGGRAFFLPPPAAAFDLLGGLTGRRQVEKDPVEPFTIYGSISKKYLIENLVDNRVVSRRKGFTASACINVLEASLQTPELARLPPGLMVTEIGGPSCAKGEGQSREDSCMPPCGRACGAAVSRHLEAVRRSTGYQLEARDRERVLRSCSTQCFQECMKPGNSIAFLSAYRF